MRIGLYPGSFDPPTLGHLNIIERAADLFDQVVVGVLVNPSKKPMFPPERRVEMMREVVAHIGGATVEQFNGLLVEFARAKQATAIIRGLRAVSDFEYEFQMAMMNRHLDGAVDTVFLMTEPEVFHVSSRLVREVAMLGGDVTHAIPPSVQVHLEKLLNERRKEST